MLREPSISQLVGQFALLGHSDKSAVSKLLGARERFILKELVRRHQSKGGKGRGQAKADSVDIFVQCSSWLSRSLFDLLEQEESQANPNGPTPAVRALVRDVYESLGGNIDLSVDEAMAEKKANWLGQKLLPFWKQSPR